MPKWFREGPSPHQTALAMIGAKPGDRVVLTSAATPDLAAALALVTGLNGRTLVVGDAGAGVRVEEAAGKVGALVEFLAAADRRIPLESGGFDVAVITGELLRRNESERATELDDAVRVLRPGGRVVIIDGERQHGLFGGLRPRSARMPPADVLALLQRARLKAHRQLADVEGVAFYEARKPV